jgi:hypothetical protein
MTAATFRIVPDPALLEGYWLALMDLPFDLFQLAYVEAVKGAEFFPRPVEIRELARAKRSNKAAQERYLRELHEAEVRADKELGPVKVSNIFQKLLQTRTAGRGGD